MTPNEHEHVARALCRASVTQDDRAPLCRFCGDRQRPDGTVDMGECAMWPAFVGEAACAIEAVRDCAMLTTRKKPRLRRPIDIVLEVRAAIHGAAG